MDQSQFKYENVAEDPKTHARAGILHTPHGDIETPIFMPVGTKANVKGIPTETVKDLGAQIVLANTYHLRKHNLSTDREIADYLVGNIHSAPQKKGFLRRHRFELSILLSVVACLALMVFAGEHWEVAFWILVAFAIVLQVGFQLISR